MADSNAYDTSVSYWRARNVSDLIILMDSNYTLLARIPHEFVQRGGHDCSRNRYLWIVLRALLQRSDSTEISIYFDGQPIDPLNSLKPGVYVAQIALGQGVQEAPGPHAKTTTRKPFSQSDTETVSNSSRSSRGGQSAFRTKLFQRDQKCLVTGTFNPKRLVACHIVPFSLGADFVARVSSGLCNLYSPANGITLRSDVHSLFDDYSLGIYCSAGQYVIHCFSGDRSLLPHHGQLIEFLPVVLEQAPEWLPDIQCLAWHYAQCVLTRFRGHHVAFPHSQ